MSCQLDQKCSREKGLELRWVVWEHTSTKKSIVLNYTARKEFNESFCWTGLDRSMNRWTVHQNVGSLFMTGEQNISQASGCLSILSGVSFEYFTLSQLPGKVNYILSQQRFPYIFQGLMNPNLVHVWSSNAFQWSVKRSVFQLPCQASCLKLFKDSLQ